MVMQWWAFERDMQNVFFSFYYAVPEIPESNPVTTWIGNWSEIPKPNVRTFREKWSFRHISDETIKKNIVEFNKMYEKYQGYMNTVNEKFEIRGENVLYNALDRLRFLYRNRDTRLQKYLEVKKEEAELGEDEWNAREKAREDAWNARETVRQEKRDAPKSREEIERLRSAGIMSRLLTQLQSS
jgi:hypothetical protein